MTSPLEPGDESFATASSQLDAGLRTCRTVLSNYRSLIAGDGEPDSEQVGFTEAGERGEGQSE